MKRHAKTVSTIVLFMLIYLTSSFLITNDIISSYATMALWLIMLLPLFTALTEIPQKQMTLVLILLVIMGLSVIINDENLRNFIAVAVSFMMAFVYVEMFGFEEFKRAFLQIMKFICVTSLIFFFLFISFPELQQYFQVTNKANNNYSFLLIYSHGVESTRNQSFFWEPGAFQTFIALALLFEVLKEKPKVMDCLIYILTMVTTFSTSGYLAMVMILILPFFRMRKENKNLRRIILWVVFFIAIYITLNPDLFFGTGDHTVFGKLINFFENDSSRDVTSASVRYHAITKAIVAFFEKPLLGWGYEGLKKELFYYTYGMNTCTFVNYFAVYGIFFGIFMIAGFVKLAKKIGTTNFFAVIIFLILFVITMSENYVNNAFFFLLVLYGFKKETYNKEFNHENIAN